MKIFDAIDLEYQRYAKAVKTYLSKTFTNFGQQYNNSTVFGQIIAVIESTVQNIMLYIEDAFTEQNKYTATRRKSIYGLAQLSGYNPSLGKAAGVQLKLSYIPTNATNLNVVIRNHEKLVCQQNGLMYHVILPQDAIVLSASKDNSNRYLYAVEGSFESQRFISQGGKLYLQHVTFSGDVDEDYMEVKVNNEIWERASCLYDMKPDGKQWFYKTSVVEGIILGFGDDVHGRALQDGDVVEITYLHHTGEYGNIDSKEHVEFDFVSPLTNIAGEEVDGNSVFNITLASTDSVTSGAFSESEDQVKQMIGFNSRALVLASPENYKEFINKFSFCGYNRTWSERGSLVVNSIIMRNYKSQLKDGKDYFNLTEKDFLLTENQKSSIVNCISNSGRQLAGVTYNIYDPVLCKYAAFVYVKPKNAIYDKEYISNKIRKCVGEFFANIKQDDYIPKSDLVYLIKNAVEEIDGVTIHFLSEANETAIINKRYIKKEVRYNQATGTYDTHETTVYVYDGEDPGVGLDAHGDIYIPSNDSYPVLMGGWRYINSSTATETQLTDIIDPLIITFE